MAENTHAHMKDLIYQYVLEIADNNLILGQRLGELCGHGPSIETDIALTNIALDLLGQTRNYYQYAAQLKEDNSTEDTIAYLRPERQYKNALLVEQPNKDFAHIIMRQFLYDVFHLLLLEHLRLSADPGLNALAVKAIKEVQYHEHFSTDWVKRLGDGTAESHRRMQEALDHLWPYAADLFTQMPLIQTLVDLDIAVDTQTLREAYQQKIQAITQEATLRLPEGNFFQTGGREGKHSEHMGYILAELQYMQRTYPNMSW